MIRQIVELRGSERNAYAKPKVRFTEVELAANARGGIVDPSDHIHRKLPCTRKNWFVAVQLKDAGEFEPQAIFRTVEFPLEEILVEAVGFFQPLVRL